MSVKEVKEYTCFLNVTVFLNFISLASQGKGRNKPRLTVKETKCRLGQFMLRANIQLIVQLPKTPCQHLLNLLLNLSL